MESMTAAFDTSRPEALPAAVVAAQNAPPRIRPGQRHYQCDVCRFMRDTGERAPGCHCTWIECANPHCPASQVHDPDGNVVRLKSRFCQPVKCRFFTQDNGHAE